MYHALVRRRVRQAFQRVSQGDRQAALERAAPALLHSFPGEDALGGQRHTRAAVARWMDRLFRLCPPTFDVIRVISTGPPWNTWVAVMWTAQVRPQAGAQYRNSGTQWLRLRWGRVTAIHEHLGTANAAKALATMSTLGVAEASAPPIED